MPADTTQDMESYPARLSPSDRIRLRAPDNVVKDYLTIPYQSLKFIFMRIKHAPKSDHNAQTLLQKYKNTRQLITTRYFVGGMNYLSKLKNTLAVRRLRRGSVPKLRSDRILAECNKQPR